MFMSISLHAPVEPTSLEGNEPSVTYEPNDLGYLLHKNPERTHAFNFSMGRAHVFFPENNAQRSTASLWVNVDSVDMVRTWRGPSGDRGQLTQYVNDRPYATNSLMSVAISRVFGTALNGKCKERPHLADVALPFTVHLPTCRGNAGLIEKLFQPLGYQIEAQKIPLDPAFPQWDECRYMDVTLVGRQTMSALLSHLYVLIPVLDNDKHYWIDKYELEKLLRLGKGWIEEHPSKEMIIRRYFLYRKGLALKALAEISPEEEKQQEAGDSQEKKLERPLSLNATRINSVVEAVSKTGATSVVDLGCGEGRLLKQLLRQRHITRITGVDVSPDALDRAEILLKLKRKPQQSREKLKLLQSSLIFRDDRLKGHDVATCVEVIEHMELDQLPDFEQALFADMAPGTVILTTPNATYNVKLEMAEGALRHGDHRFEWDQPTFQSWGNRIAETHGYQVSFQPIGEVDPELGPPTQMAVFSRVP